MGDSFVAQIHRLEDEKQQLEEKLQVACSAIEVAREEREELRSRLEKSDQQAAQWKLVAERYQDVAVAIRKLLENLDANVHCPMTGDA